MKKVRVFFNEKIVEDFIYETHKDGFFFIGNKLIADFSNGNYAFYFYTACHKLTVSDEDIKSVLNNQK